MIIFVLPVPGGWTMDLTGSVGAGFLPTVLVSAVAVWASGGLRRAEAPAAEPAG